MIYLTMYLLLGNDVVFYGKIAGVIELIGKNNYFSQI